MEESHTYFQFVSVNKHRNALLPKGGRISTLRGGGQDSRVYLFKKKKRVYSAMDALLTTRSKMFMEFMFCTTGAH